MENKRTKLDKINFTNDELKLIRSYNITDLETLLWRFYRPYIYDNTGNIQFLFYDLFESIDMNKYLVDILVSINPKIHRDYALLYAHLYLQYFDSVDSIINTLVNDLSNYESSFGMKAMMSGLLRELPNDDGLLIKSLWVKGLDIKDICKKFNISRSVLIRRLKLSYHKLRSEYAKDCIRAGFGTSHIPKFNIFPLSIRTCHVLARHHIYEIIDVANLFTPPYKIRKLRNIGVCAANEIYDVLKSYIGIEELNLPNIDESWRRKM